MKNVYTSYNLVCWNATRRNMDKYYVEADANMSRIHRVCIVFAGIKLHGYALDFTSVFKFI